MDVIKEKSKKFTFQLILFRFFAVVFALAGLIMLEGLTEGLEPWIRSALAFDPHPEELRFHGAVHGALLGILFSGSLFALLFKPLTKPLLLQFYFIGHFIFLGTLIATGPMFALTRFSVFIIFGIIMAILYATYTKRKEIFKPVAAVVINRPLMIMLAIAVLGLLPFMINGAIMQFQETEEQFRWGEGTALALTMLYGGFLTAKTQPGSRTLGILLSLTYVYMGAASIALPNHEGSWTLYGGILAILYGCIYFFLVLTQIRSRVTDNIIPLNAKTH